MYKHETISNEMEGSTTTNNTKPNKSIYLESNSYRPLSMINTIGKLYEAIITNKIEERINENGGFNETQYGFTKKKNTIQAIKKIISIIEENKSNEYYQTLILLDIEGAFDNAWWPHLLQN